MRRADPVRRRPRGSASGSSTSRATATLRVLTARDGERLHRRRAAARRRTAAPSSSATTRICDYMDAVVTPGFERAFFACVLEQLADDGVTDARPARPARRVADAARAARSGRRRRLHRRRARRRRSRRAVDAAGDVGRLPRHALEEGPPRDAPQDAPPRHAGGDVAAARHHERRRGRRRCSTTLFHLMRISNHHKEEFLDRPGMEDVLPRDDAARWPTKACCASTS